MSYGWPVIASSLRPAVADARLMKPAVPSCPACPGHPQRQSATTDGRDKLGRDGGSDAIREPGLVLGT
jgi:hypothetical protein